MAIVVWGIPSCGTVKKARAALDAAGVAFEARDLRATPPTRADVDRFVAALGAAALKNTSGGSYRALGDAKDGYSEADWRAAFVADPMLLKRPIVEVDGRTVAVGFKDADALLRAVR